MSFLSKVELKKQLQAKGIKVEGNYVRKKDIINIIADVADIDDACDLAQVWLEEYNPESIIDNAKAHIDQIALFNPEHPAIPLIKNLVRVSQHFKKEVIPSPFCWS